MRGATTTKNSLFPAPDVSIHAPVRGQPAHAANLVPVRFEFQFTPPCGGQPATLPSSANWQSVFQFTPPCGGQPTSLVTMITPATSFNSRPRAGGNVFDNEVYEQQRKVSIHAPVRGATSPPETAPCRPLSVSIHAPVRGATLKSLFLQSRRAWFQFTPPCGGQRGYAPILPAFCGCFNSRPRAGGNDLIYHMLNYHRLVSIHAPVRGATCQWVNSRRINESFNSRPRAGGNRLAGKSVLDVFQFQFTPPCGGQRLMRS